MGACMAIEDAATLARLLIDSPWPQALPAYERERKRRAEDVVRHGRRMGHVTQLDSVVAIWLRDQLLAHMPEDKLHDVAREMASGE
jgi:2-polyprenyl-6-methoxyphenol hydroxylase-like FAD-dependent oxidoreductase